MGPLQAVFSVVFGDGDPNYDREQRSLGAVASLARRNGGVLTAEQMAPLLDPPAYDKEQTGVVDESWLLPSLAALGAQRRQKKMCVRVVCAQTTQTTLTTLAQTD